MRNRGNLSHHDDSNITETPAEFFQASLEAYASRIMECLLDLGMPEEQVWDAFRTAASTLNVAADGTGPADFVSQRSAIG